MSSRLGTIVGGGGHAFLPRALGIVLALLAASPSLAQAVVHSLHPGVLEQARARGLAGDPVLRPALERLTAEADQALRQPARSVMDKTRVATSGDRHDYFSFGPYWWPDPGKPGGLPYVRRDGETNPDSQVGTDHGPIKDLGQNVWVLALAYHLTGREPYAAHAATLLRAWFLDPATRMNPHLRYAQAIPGITDGRGIGIIETRYLLPALDGAALVFQSASWTKQDERGLREWLEAYNAWLRTSPNGLDESDEENNHGTWYDVQVAQLALALGHKGEAEGLIRGALAKRVSTQIEPDGRQPRELARTKPLNYSLLNLEGLVQLATMGEYLGIDGWAVRTADGASIIQYACGSGTNQQWTRQ